MKDIALTPSTAAKLAELARPYLWWPSADGQGHGLSRQVAQIMRLGTYDDILTLERLVEPKLLADVMRLSAPGWFDDRSWNFWRGRLSGQAPDIPERRPQRTFDRAAHV